MNIGRLDQNMSENLQNYDVILDVNGVVISPFGLKLSQNGSLGSEDHFLWVSFPFPAARDQKKQNIARKTSKIQ